jgi:hypothetical protein
MGLQRRERCRPEPVPPFIHLNPTPATLGERDRGVTAPGVGDREKLIRAEKRPGKLSSSTPVLKDEAGAGNESGPAAGSDSRRLRPHTQGSSRTRQATFPS